MADCQTQTESLQINFCGLWGQGFTFSNFHYNLIDFEGSKGSIGCLSVVLPYVCVWKKFDWPVMASNTAEWVLLTVRYFPYS